MKKALLILILVSTHSFAGDWDKIKEKANEVAQKTEENIEEAKKDIQKATEVATEQAKAAAEVAAAQAEEAIDKNEAGFERLVARGEKNARNELNNIEEGIKHAAQEFEEFLEEVKADLKDENEPKTNLESLVAVELQVTKETELQPLPNAEQVRFVSQDEQMKESFLKYLNEKTFYTYSRSLTDFVIVLHEGSKLFPIATETLDLSSSKSLLEQIKTILGESAATLKLKSTAYSLEDGSVLVVHNFSL